MTTYLGKSCSFGLPRVPLVNCRRFMYLVISLLVYRTGCGIWLYQFLIIAYLFTFPTMCWLPKLNKRPYKTRFIACTTTELSKLLTSCLTAVKNHVIRYCEKVYERSGKNLFWSIKNSGAVLNKLKSRGFRATSLSTYDFPHSIPLCPII